MSDLRIGVSPEEATAELNAVVSSSAFGRSPRLSLLLTYLCTKYLAGEADQIKEYSIGVEVLQRPPSFDPSTDAGARVEVHRLRRRLQQYYEGEGADRKLRIMIPVGHYVPAFVPNELAEAKPPAAAAAAMKEVPPEVPFGLVADIVAREPFPTPGRTVFTPRNIGIASGALVILFGAIALARLTRAPARTESRSIDEVAVASTPARSSRPPALAVAVLGGAVLLACGRTVAYTDRSGHTWDADHYYQGGTAFESPRQFFARAYDSKLYQYGRSGDFSYDIPLRKGNYELHLGFVETTYGPNMPSGGGEYSRTFDVKANGKLLLEDFDIYSDADGPNIADSRVFKDIQPGDDGFLHLEFHSRRAPALVNTIQLLPARPHRLNVIRLVAQENFLTLGNGTVWNPDTFVTGGQLAGHPVDVHGTEEPDLYERERYGHFDYAIPVDRGSYALSLYFAEEYFGPGNPGGGPGAGSRVFDVHCNGIALLRDFDIFKEGGMSRALVRTFHGLTPNAQGKLQISFVPVRNYASLYALEVTDETQ